VRWRAAALLAFTATFGYIVGGVIGANWNLGRRG
jgi:hypothetical protein